MKIRGEASYVKKNKKYNLSGEFEVPEDNNFQKIKVTGEIKFHKIISMEEVDFCGNIFGDEVKTNKFLLDGRAELAKIFSQDISIIFSSKSRYGSIEANNIKIRPQKESKLKHSEVISVFETLLRIKFPKVKMKNEILEIHIDFLKGENIEIESCVVDKIVCKNAKIAGRCRIGTLFYEGTVSMDSQAQIQQKINKKYES